MRSLPLFCLLLISSLACTTAPVVYTDTAPNVNFTTYETYAYLPSGENDEARSILTQKIIDEVTQEMEARGYELDNQNPDLLVNVKTMYEEEEELVRTGSYPATYDYYVPGFYTPTTINPYYYTGYATIPRVTGTGIREVAYTEGTFVVDIIDREDNRILWRGWSETPVDRMNLSRSIRAYIDNIFEEYPVEAQEAQP